MTELTERKTRERIKHYDSEAAVGKRILAARLAANLSQRELAFPGCGAAYISRIERGERVPSLQTMGEIAKRTGVTTNYLAFGKELIDPEVAAAVNRAMRAATENSADLVDAYKALGAAARKAAKKIDELGGR